MVPRRDEGGRDGRAAEPEGLLSRWGRWTQQEPVQGALMGLLHIKVAETTGTQGQTGPQKWVGQAETPWTGRVVRPELTATMASPAPTHYPCPVSPKLPTLPLLVLSPCCSHLEVQSSSLKDHDIWDSTGHASLHCSSLSSSISTHSSPAQGQGGAQGHPDTFP